MGDDRAVRQVWLRVGLCTRSSTCNAVNCTQPQASQIFQREVSFLNFSETRACPNKTLCKNPNEHGIFRTYFR